MLVGSGFPNPVHITPIDLGTRKMDSFWVDVVVPIYCLSGDLVCCDQAVIFFFLRVESFPDLDSGNWHVYALQFFLICLHFPDELFLNVMLSP